MQARDVVAMSLCRTNRDKLSPDAYDAYADDAETKMDKCELGVGPGTNGCTNARSMHAVET